MIIKHRYTWVNSIKNDQAQPIMYVVAENRGDVVQAIKMSESSGLKVRAVGSGHSFNDIACSNGCLIDISRLNNFLPQLNFLKTPFKDDKRFVNVEAGITIHDFNIGLDTLGLSVVNMGAIDHQTLAGAIATGTHGTGKDLPALSGMVRSIVLVSSGGKIFRIEPANGISDPTQHQEENVTLVQNDDDFYSVLVGLGGFGIICSYVMETVEMYWLRESKTIHKWSEIKSKLQSGELFTGARHVVVQVNPYPVPEEENEHWCLLVRIEEIPKEHRDFGEATRNLLSSFFGNNALVYWFTRLRFRYAASKTPQMLQGAIKALKDKEYINKSYKVLHQGVGYIKERGYDAEFAFNMTAPYWEVIEKLFERADLFRKKGNLYSTGPFCLRFVQRSHAYLTPEHERDVCYIDTTFLQGTVGVEDMLEDYQQTMFAMGGMPHWGKKIFKLGVHLDKLPLFYPKLNTWRQTRNRYDPKKTFINAYMEKYSLV